MRRSVIFGAAAASCLGAATASAATLDEVRARGHLACGVNPGLAGFAASDASGEWSGFDVAFCRALAAAVLGDPKKVRFVSGAPPGLLAALQKGEVDIVPRSLPATFTHDAEDRLTFAGISYYDGQGFMIRKDMGPTSVKELDGASVCIQTGTTAEMNLADFFRQHNIGYKPVLVDSGARAQQQYLSGGCQVYTTEASALAATRASFADAAEHVMLPEIISKEPMGPAVRQGDAQWADIVRWTLNALIAAEEHGVTSANIEELAKGTSNPEVNRLLGTEGDLGETLGLERNWAVRAIQAGGNYGEIFAATIGEATPIGLARGLNAQWTKGGLLYALPFR
jgi:general L-amino acid transport system substrate-binding protein